jgi:hypothetical protein
MAQRKKGKSSLVLVADFGGSGSKFLYRVDDEWHSLMMPSETASVKSHDRTESSLDDPLSPEYNCWFDVHGTTYYVGYAAQQKWGHAGLKQNKFTRAVVKLLGALSVIAARNDLLNNKRAKSMNLLLSMFLPYDEVSNFPYFITHIPHPNCHIVRSSWLK